VEPESVRDVDDLALRSAEMGTAAIVGGVAVRNDRIQPVIDSGQFDNDQHAPGMFFDAGPLERLCGERRGRAGEEHRQRGADANPVETAREEVASRAAARHCDTSDVYPSWYSGVLSTR